MAWRLYPKNSFEFVSGVEMATDKVLAFFDEHQRPYSVTDVQNTIKDIGKAAAQKALNDLIEQGKLREKAYGKQKVYFLCQSDATSSKQLNEDVLTLDRQINDITSKMQEDRTKLVAIEAKLAETKGQMSLSDALEKKIELENTLKGLKVAVKQFEGRDPVAPDVSFS